MAFLRKALADCWSTIYPAGPGGLEKPVSRLAGTQRPKMPVAS
jgi:hypothetical protein